MSRAWICDSEYGKKFYEDRAEDINPCIRCNKCHVPNDSDKFRSFCSVNPKIGVEFYGAGKRLHFIGDCRRAGDVHKAVTAGWAVANQIY